MSQRKGESVRDPTGPTSSEDQRREAMALARMLSYAAGEAKVLRLARCESAINEAIGEVVHEFGLTDDEILAPRHDA